jgi:hypothetical protein
LTVKKSPDERSRWLVNEFSLILTYAVDRFPDGVQEHVIAVADRYGDDGMYGICCALAQTVLKLGFPGIERGDGSLQGDGMLIIEQLSDVDPDPHTLWASRFIATYINGDTDSNVHLFYSARDETPYLVRSVIELISIAADMARLKREELRQGSGS